MAGGCRDCSRCTESCLVGFLLMPFRVIGFMLGGFLVKAVRSNCPQCGHAMSQHARRADGSLKD